MARLVAVTRPSGAWPAAEDCYTRALPLKRRYAQPGDLAATINNLAVVQADRGALDAALNSLAEAEQIYREHEQLTGVSQVLINRGKFLTSLGQLDGAQAAYEEALQVIEQTGRKNIEGNNPLIRVR